MIYYIYLDLSEKQAKKTGWLTAKSLKKPEITAGTDSPLKEGSLIDKIFGNSSEGFLILNELGFFVYVNKQVEKDLGSGEETLVGKNFIDVVKGEHGSESLIKNYEKVIKQKRTFQIQTYRFKTRRWYFMHAYPFKGGIAVSYTDITKQKTIEKVVQRHQRFLKRVLRTINDGILIYDLNYRVLFINRTAKSMLGEVPVGRKVSQKLLNRFVDLETGEVFPKEKLPYFRVLKTGRSIRGVEFGVLKEDKKQVVVSVSSVPWVDKEGRLEGVVSVLNDITLEREADYQREQIIGIVGHEMKNPLASIKLLSQMMKKQMDKQGQVTMSEYAGKIDEKVDTLVKIINNLTEATKIRLGRIDMHWEVVEVDDFIEEMIEELQPIMGTHKLIIQGKTGVRTLADKDRLKEVIVNLVGNAVKYSPGKDQVLVKLRRRNGSYVIEVVDYGVGISETDIKKIFNLYYSGKQKGVGLGTGIGLYVVKGVITAHGGTIEVESNVGRGSIFRVILPIENNRKKPVK